MDWYRLLPQYWYQQSHTDWEWDKVLNEILDNLQVIKEGYLTHYLDGVEVWTSGGPYGYGSWYNIGRASGLPTVKTRKRLKSVIDNYRNSAFAERVKKQRENRA